jgi:hypothetical protein
VATPDQRGRRIRLTGERFDGGRLPVDSLVELERYQTLLRAIARAEWEEDHPGEVPPAELDAELRLTIERIESGSADVFLIFEQVAVYADYQEQAQDALDGVIAAAYDGTELPDLPLGVADQVRVGMLELGQSLEPDQSIEVFVEGSDEPVVITIETRGAAIAHLQLDGFFLNPSAEAPKASLEKQSETLVGRITELDANRSTYHFESLQYGELKGHYKKHPDLIEDLRKVVDQAEVGPVLRVEGELQYRDGKPWRFTDTIAVEEFTAGGGPWAPTLIDFAQLSSGWGEHGVGLPIAFVALDAAGQIMQALAAGGSELPGVFPSQSGGVILEWASRSMVRSVEITPNAEFELFAMPADTSTGTLEVTTNLDEAINFSKGGAQ